MNPNNPVAADAHPPAREEGGHGTAAGPGRGRRGAGSGGLWGGSLGGFGRVPQAESSGQRLTQRAQVLLEILVSQHLPIPGEVDWHFGGRMAPDGHEAGGSSCWVRWGSGY